MIIQPFTLTRISVRSSQIAASIHRTPRAESGDRARCPQKSAPQLQGPFPAARTKSKNEKTTKRNINWAAQTLGGLLAHPGWKPKARSSKQSRTGRHHD